jgi:general secretion pathway protein E
MNEQTTTASAETTLSFVSAGSEQDIAAAERVPLPEVAPDFLAGHGILPLRSEAERLVVAVAAPPPFAALDALRQRLGISVLACLLPRDGIERRLQELYGFDSAPAPAAAQSSALDELDDVEHDLSTLKALAEDAPVVKLAQELLAGAIEARASDLHLEIFQNEFRVRQRVDGILIDRPSPPRKLYLPLISHLKLRAQMNIAERRLPQDGRIKLTRDGREVDLRISTVPTVHGESMAIRLLDQGPGLVSMDQLGLSAAARELFGNSITLPHGMILVTGPTGSGKTTTLYSLLGVLNRPELKIITVEDPVEYQISGVNQIQVKPQIDLTFASALRSIVRQDPDVLMVGEIRDQETAEIAIQSALTGHLVFSTLHTNDAAGAPHRLLDMGVEPYLIASSVVLIVAQRLVRTLCPHCRTQHAITAADRLFLSQHGLDIAEGQLSQAVGCPRCAGTGYQGRSGIFEMFPVSERIKEAILLKEPSGAIRRIMQDEGHASLYADGLQKVLAGVTTLEELARVARWEAQYEGGSAA